MKIITTFIRPIKLDDVRAALAQAGITELQVIESKAFGVQRTRTEIYRGTEYNTKFLPNIRIECLVHPDRVDSIVEAIAHAARTGKGDDGRIIVSDAEIVVQIRTGQRDDSTGPRKRAAFGMPPGPQPCGERARVAAPEDAAGRDQ